MSRESCISSGPRGPAVMEFWLSVTGIPAEVIKMGGADLFMGVSLLVAAPLRAGLNDAIGSLPI